MSRVGADRAFFGQHIVEHDGQGARVYVGGGTAVLIRLVAGASLGDLALEPFAPEPLTAHVPPIQLIDYGPGGSRRVPDDTDVDSMQPSDRRLVEIYLHHACFWGEQFAVAYGPVVERRAEREHEVRTPQQPHGERGGEPAGYPDAERVAGKEPVPHRARRQHGPHPVTQGLESVARKGCALPGDDGGPVREGEQIGDRGDRSL